MYNAWTDMKKVPSICSFGIFLQCHHWKMNSWPDPLTSYSRLRFISISMFVLELLYTLAAMQICHNDISQVWPCHGLISYSLMLFDMSSNLD